MVPQLVSHKFCNHVVYKNGKTLIGAEPSLLLKSNKK